MVFGGTLANRLQLNSKPIANKLITFFMISNFNIIPYYPDYLLKKTI